MTRMKTKTEYIEEIQNNFEKDWEALQKNLQKEIQGVKFADVFDLVERIHADVKMDMEYRRMLGERDLWTKFSEFDLYVRKNTESIVREFNRLYDNLSYIFQDDGQCNIVKLTLNGGLKNFNRYLVSTRDLYNIDEYSFKMIILGREQGLDFIDAEYKSLNMDEYLNLMKLIASRSSYKRDKEFVFFDDKLYDGFYNSVERCDDIDIFHGFDMKKLVKRSEKEKKKHKGK